MIRTITVGQFVYAFFRPYGESGLLLALFVIFYLDATFFPTLPELFTVIIFLAMPKPEFGLLMLVTISIAEFSGITSLYYIVKYYDLPNWIKNKMVSYSKLFIVKDEKVILLNRIAPVIPFLGAFIATCRWPYAKSIFYNFGAGGVSGNIHFLSAYGEQQTHPSLSVVTFGFPVRPQIHHVYFDEHGEYFLLLRHLITLLKENGHKFRKDVLQLPVSEA